MVLLSQNVAILDRLLAAQSFAAQSEALRALKNETVGHVMKKEKWVELGVLRPIVRVLLPERPSNWQHLADATTARSGAHSRQPSTVSPPDNLAADDLAHLQALELLGIFASGGPRFLAPLNAAGALPAILDYIDPDVNHPRLVYAALRTLSTLINTAQLISVSPLAPSPISLTTLADAVLAPSHIHAFYDIIVAAPRAWWTESITNTAITIISSLCITDVRHQVALTKAGILDALAVKIASYVVLRGQVVPGADLAAEKEGLRDAIPGPATHLLDVAGVFNAVAAILGDSRLHTCMLLSAPSILAIFPQLDFESSSSDIHAAWKAINTGGFGGLDHNSMGALDYLLPALPAQQQYPPLYGRVSTTTNKAPNHLSSTGLARWGMLPRQQRQSQQLPRAAGASKLSASPPANGSNAASGVGTHSFAEGLGEDSESPMIPWLVDLVRSTTGRERLTAASVLTSIYKAGFATKTSRESAMAILIVPLLLRMLESSSRENDDEKALATQQMITETAISVLARLVANNDVLQKAAVDGKAIQTLAKLLKESYEPVPVHISPRPWNPTPTSSANPTRTGTPVASMRSTGVGAGRPGQANAEDNMEDGPVGGETRGSDGPSNSYSYDHPYMLQMSRTLGPKGQNALLAHRIRLREAILKALTALLATKYDYQKAFVEQDAMLYIVASLSPTPSKPRNNTNDGGSDKIDLSINPDEIGTDIKCDPEYGRNPVGVLVAACNCVRMLSRSIAIMRTTLEDAGVAAPIYRLLRHTSTSVQIASTAVVCNLVTETSPMRERYIKSGIMDELCTHAHSQTSAIRLNALWALKHLVDGVGPAVKKACLEQLGSGWLLRLIDYDSESDSATSSFHEAADNFRGIPSDSFATQPSADVRMDEDVEMGQSDGEHKDKEFDDDENGGNDINSHGQAAASVTAGKMPWTATPVVSAGAGTTSSLQRARFPQTSHERSRTGRLRQAEAKIAALRDLEQNAQRRSVHDDILIQEQGLHFIRNLIGLGSVLPVAAPSPGSPVAAHTLRPSDSSESSSAAVPAAVVTAGGSSAIVRDPTNDATEMIDYLFNEFGQDQFFAMLLHKVRPRLRPLRFSTRSADGPASLPFMDTRAVGRDVPRMQAPRAKVIEAVVYILVHIAAGVVRHRQIVVAQTELMRTLMGQFTSRDKDVRVALCHLVSNLTWRDSTADTMGAQQRGLELKKLGAGAHLEHLLTDGELDVREQAKMAADQLGLKDSNKELT
ncbi:armadillo repeat protein [Ophiostoma piceae UAMH 11346]|uniref:Armadillo repeat protein n=1 Tax=Ophiostoma piceae (strain UAMH 11346) TaxID=1262450 RepID=S3C7L0_OPHP1|nr:armadillo repeat protein [Ophiostoma piceae UAMH 11346]